MTPSPMTGEELKAFIVSVPLSAIIRIKIAAWLRGLFKDKE